MNQEQMLRKLREEESRWQYWDESKTMYDKLNREELIRKMAEDAYFLWLQMNNPDSIKFGYPNNPNDYEKFMFIEGYLASRR